MKGLGIFGLTALLLAGAAARGAAQEAAAATPRVNAVRFEGLAALEPDLVREAIVSRGSRCRSILLAPVCALAGAAWAEETAGLDTVEVQRDRERIRALYAAWGYPDAEVTSRIVSGPPGSVDIHFRIAEGTPLLVRSLRVVGLEAIPDATRRPATPLPLRAGAPFAPVRVEATGRWIGSRLAELGYPFAQVEVAEVGEPQDGRVDVVLAVRPGPLAVFGRTVVLPGRPLRVADVERRLAYRVGERFSPSALTHTAERLYRLPVVGRVFIDPLPAADADSVVVTTIGVTPRRVQGLQFGGAFSTTSCLGGTLGWGHRYAFGAPRSVNVRGTASNLLGKALRRFPCTGVGEGEFAEVDYAASVDVEEPLGADGWLLLGAEFSRFSAPQAFIRRGVQARIGVRRALTRTLDGSLLYTPEWRDLLAAGPLFCAVHGVCEDAGIAELADRATLAPLQLSLAWTPPLARQPPGPPPTGPAWMHPPPPHRLLSGRVTTTAAEGVTGSKFTFGSVVLEGSVVVGRGRTVEAAAHLRLGTLLGAGGPLPPHVRLFGGGPRGVRGVPTYRLGPKVLTATPDQLAVLGCAPVPGGCEGVEVDPRQVRVRPTGGDRLVELSLETRRWVHQQLQLAAFLDVGAVRSGARPGTPASASDTESVWTPGLGALALTPFGPVRVDVAYNPAPRRRYPLLMRTSENGGQTFLGEVEYDPFGFADPSPLRESWRRLQFQLSLGLPF